MLKLQRLLPIYPEDILKKAFEAKDGGGVDECVGSKEDEQNGQEERVQEETGVHRGQTGRNLIFAILCIAVFDWRSLARENRGRLSIREFVSYVSRRSRGTTELLWQVRKL